jgi:tyrosyl-tRNA synthetase
VVFIIGDFTAMVGDPSGVSATRPRLTEEEAARNAVTYGEQVLKVLDPAKTVIERNSRWLGRLGIHDVLNLAAHYTVARMLERDDFSKRWESHSAISILEFLYPLLVAYDSVFLKADVELGGTDQKFNLLTGRTLMERMGLEPQVCLTMPMLRGLDGERKMSKSYDNYIGLTESPPDVYGKTMSIPDALLEEWITLVSSAPDLGGALARARSAPYEAKRALAADIVTQLHGAEAARSAAEHFDILFRKKETPAERPSFTHAPAKLTAILKDLGFAKSASEARRMIEQGGVQLDGEKCDDPDAVLAAGDYVVKYGKLKFADVHIR